MAELHISALHLEPLLGGLVDLRIWIDPVQPIPPDGLVIRLQQDGRGALQLPTELRLSAAHPTEVLRVAALQAGDVRIQATSEPYRLEVEIPRFRRLVGRMEWPDPIVLRASHSVDVKSVLPMSAGGTCTRGGTPSALLLDTLDWRNWHGNNVKAGVRRIRLGTTGTTMAQRVAEVVEAVLFAESSGLKPGIRGTGWSFTECVVGSDTTLLIDTDALNQPRSELMGTALRREDVAAGLVHVEAGIKIHELNCLLFGSGLAMPTLGGSRGQSVAGAMSTGVHGGDVNLPPLADAIAAIHLVGAGGQEWWIEPASRRITDPRAMADLRTRGTFCRRIRIEYSDDLFNSVLVSMGCAGIIYSVVLRARRAFNLRTTRSGKTWDEAKSLIGRIASDTRVADYVDINVSGADRACRVTLREESELTPTAAPARSPGIGSVANLVGLIGPGALVELSAEVTRIIAHLLALIPRIPLIPAGDFGAIAEFATLGISPWSAEATLNNLRRWFELLNGLGALAVDSGNPERVAAVLPSVINYAWSLGSIARSGRALVDALQHQLTLSTLADETSVLPSHTARTGQTNCPTHPQDHDASERLVESFEFAVDISACATFVERILDLVAELRVGPDALVVNINLRFTRKTRAMLGMQQFDRTCHLEIYTFKGVAGNGAFHLRLITLAKEQRAIPHWGQMHTPDFDFKALFGENLETWRWAMNKIASEARRSPTLFWTEFARTRRLLDFTPTPDPPGIRRVATGRYRDGRAVVFALSAGGSLWRLDQRGPNEDWGKWQRLGGANHEMAALAHASGTLEIVAVAANGSVRQIGLRQPSGPWGEWRDQGGLAKQVALSRNQDGRLEMFAIAQDDALHHNYEATPGGPLSGWESLGGVLKQIAVGSNQDGRLEVFAIDGDNGLLHIFQLAPNSGWSGWESLGGVVKQIAVGANGDGRLEVFGIGPGDRLHHIYQVAPNNGWSGWESLGGPPLKQMVVASNADGRLEVFAVGTGTGLHHIYQVAANSGWSRWEALGGEISEIAVGRHSTGRLIVFAVEASEAGLQRIEQLAPNSGWSTWASLGAPRR